MAKTSTKPATVDPRDRYIDGNMSSWTVQLPPKAIEDLRYFGKRAKEGRPITLSALQKWMLDNYKQKIGIHRLATIALANDIQPWWRTRS